MKFLRLLSFLILLLPTSGAKAALVQEIRFPYDWVGGAYTDDETGQFSHCAASGTYNSGVTLIVSVNRLYGWVIGFQNSAWNFRPDSEQTVFIKIDNSLWKTYKATAIKPDFLGISMPNEQSMINLFRFGQLMQMNFDSSYFDFRLIGTAKLLSGLADCVKDHLSPPKVAKAPKEKPRPKPVSPSAEAVPAKEAKKEEPEQKGTFTGTGIIVAETGIMLTNNHVVEDCKTITFSQEGELPQSASLLRYDKTNDLAIIKSAHPFDPENVATFRLAPPVKAGEEVAVYGFPLTGMLSTTGNVVSGNVSSLAGLGDDVRFYQTSAPVQPGNSGGPLLDYAANVIGIVTARIDDFVVAGATGSIPQNVNFALKSQIATSFMDTHSVEYHSSTVADRKDLSSVVDQAKKFTVLVECKR